MPLEFHRIPYKLPNMNDPSGSAAIVCLDQSLPQKTATLECMRKAHCTMDLTLHPRHKLWDKSLPAQRVYFLNIARSLMDAPASRLALKNIYMVFEVQLSTAQLHCHANLEFEKDTYITHNMVLIKRMLKKVYDLKPCGFYVSPIKNPYDRVAYILKVNTKQPGFLAHFENTIVSQDGTKDI